MAVIRNPYHVAILYAHRPKKARGALSMQPDDGVDMEDEGATARSSTRTWRWSEAAPLLPTPVSQSIARGMRQVRNNAAQEHMNAQGMKDA